MKVSKLIELLQKEDQNLQVGIYSSYAEEGGAVTKLSFDVADMSASKLYFKGDHPLDKRYSKNAPEKALFIIGHFDEWDKI